VVEDSSAESVLGPVDFAVGAKSAGRGVDGAVPIGFADVSAAVGVNFAKGGDGIDGDGIGADAYDWACGLGWR
jgi:hypothetical protein